MASNNRRQLETRKMSWAQALGRLLASSGITPNQISTLSMVFGALTAYALFKLGQHPRSWIWVLCSVASIQLRLLCNMLDGLVAIEGKRKSLLGDLYNDIPDRVSDTLSLASLMFVLADFSWGVHVAYAAAIFALGSAYLRYLGLALVKASYFSGPGAKQHRMFVLSVGLLLTPFEMYLGLAPHQLLLMTSVLIVVLSCLSCLNRLSKIVRDLKNQESV